MALGVAMNPLSEPSNLLYGSVPKAGQTGMQTSCMDRSVRQASIQIAVLNLTIYFGELDYRSDMTDGT